MVLYKLIRIDLHKYDVIYSKIISIYVRNT